MRQRNVMLFSFFVLACSYSIAQTSATVLRTGAPLERSIKLGQKHTFRVKLEPNQLLKLVVDQKGIDVMIRVSSPGGKRLGEFDSPNGPEGEENVSIVARESGDYEFEVAPLEEDEETASGNYSIAIREIRAATRRELDEENRKSAAREKAIALLLETIGSIAQIHSVDSRVNLQLRTAQLLWATNELPAKELFHDAAEGAKQFIAKIDTEDPDYQQKYQTAMQLRSEIIQSLSVRDPVSALDFLNATNTLIDPNAGSNNRRSSLESDLENIVASRVAQHDPKQAMQIAEDSLKKGYSGSILNIVSQLRRSDPPMSARLAGEIASKLQSENLLKYPDAANLALGLLRISAMPLPNRRMQDSGSPEGQTPLLSDDDTRALLSKLLSAAMSLPPPRANVYSEERNFTQNILNSLQGMGTQLEKYAPGSAATIEKRVAQFNGSTDPQAQMWQKYQQSAMTGSVEDSLAAVGSAPPEYRDQLYQNVALRALEQGNIERANQIVKEHVVNPDQQRQFLKNLQQQSIYSMMSKGRTEEALRMLDSLGQPREKIQMLVQILNQIGAGQSREGTLRLLTQIRGMIGVADRAQNTDQMNALCSLGLAYGRLDSTYGLEILVPLIAQFNELCDAGLTLSGFDQEYYRDGELMMSNGNSLSNIANELIASLAASSNVDFDRVKQTAAGLSRPEVRVAAYIAISETAIR